MQTPYVTYREAMGELSKLIRSPEPGYVRVRAICAVVNELSPANSAQRENHLALGLEPHPDPEPRPEPQPKRRAAHPVLAKVDALMRGEDPPTFDDEEDDEEEEEPQ